MLVMWTDGSASPNPGPGGFAVLSDDGTPLVLGSSEKKPTTNIRMEASALIAAMEYAGKEPCEIHTDSEFWINVLTKWAPTWEQNNWKKKKGEIKNLDLVKELYHLYQQNDVKLVWVRGHADIELNELADKTAKLAREHQTLS